MKKYYRADKRDFSVGDTITSAKEFMYKNPEGALDVEAAFESVRLGCKQKREDALFVFEDLAAAQKHWCKMTGGKLYEVAVEDADVIHRGDMALFEGAFENRNENDILHAFAARYWSGELSEKPVIEVLVIKSVVSSVISKDEAERRQCFSKYAKGKL